MTLDYDSYDAADDFEMIDRMIIEYLLFRGFTRTHATFAEERKEDLSFSLQIQKTVQF